MSLPNVSRRFPNFPVLLALKLEIYFLKVGETKMFKVKINDKEICIINYMRDEKTESMTIQLNHAVHSSSLCLQEQGPL